MNKSGDFYLNGTSNKAKSFCFGGKSGMQAILLDPTSLSGLYKGSIVGDLEVSILDDSRLADYFMSRQTSDEEIVAGLKIMKLSEKGKYLGAVEFEFSDVSLLSLRKDPDSTTDKDRSWMILAICFNSVKAI